MKKVTELDDQGRVFTMSKAQRKSETRLIPLTPAPKTRWQKFKRAAVG